MVQANIGRRRSPQRPALATPTPTPTPTAPAPASSSAPATAPALHPSFPPVLPAAIAPYLTPRESILVLSVQGALICFLWICIAIIPRPFLVLYFWQQKESGNEQSLLVTCITVAWLLELLSLVSLVVGEPLARTTAATLFLLANVLFVLFMAQTETKPEYVGQEEGVIPKKSELNRVV